MLLHGHRAAARTAAAVRRGERLVQIQVHHVHAEIAGPRDAHQRVHIGAIHVEQRALAMQDLRPPAMMCSSNTPSVLGFVTIRPATSSVTDFSSAPRSIMPCSSERMFSTT